MVRGNQASRWLQRLLGVAKRHECRPSRGGNNLHVPYCERLCRFPPSARPFIDSVQAKMVYVQLVRFAPRAHRWNHSPKAIQAVWDPSLATPENPDTPGWVELAKTQEETPPFKINIVALDYAAGRIARLARSSWNAIIVSQIYRTV